MNYKRRRLRKAAPRITVGYVRVSSEEQAQNGVSLDAQEARILAYAQALGLHVDEVIRDAGVSAKSLDRPGMQRVIDGVREGRIERCIVLKLDRATRSTRDLATLLDLFAKRDAALVSVSEHLDTQTAAGRMVVAMLGVVAQWEREAVGERTAFALAHKRLNRVAYGRTPYGFRREGERLIADAEQQKALELMRSLRAEGASYQEICDRLDAEGYAPKGTRWFPNSVRQILTSRMEADAA